MMKLRNGQSFPKKEEEEPPPPPTVAKVPTPASGAAMKRDVIVEDTDALNCSICFLPIKPPIFQCQVGHVVCSPCRDKLQNPAKCHVCGGATGGFRRCHAMERLVESIHVPCPNTSHGCTATPAYYEQRGHQKTCLMVSRFHCPGEACGFVDSMDSLLAHFAGVHHWPCTTVVRETRYENCKVRLRKGFNFLRTNLPSAIGGSTQFLFLLNLARRPVGAAVSELCVQPPHSPDRQRSSLEKALKCEVKYSRYSLTQVSKGDLIRHYQSSKFKVACTDFSKGLPNLNNQFQFVVPKFALGRIGDTNPMEIDFYFTYN